MSFDDAIEAIIEAEGRERNPMAKCENAVCLKVLRETFIGFLKMNHLYIYISMCRGWEGQVTMTKKLKLKRTTRNPWIMLILYLDASKES